MKAQTRIGHGEEEVAALTGYGRDLLFVARVLERWLAKTPGGPVELGTAAAERKIAALHAANDSGFLNGSVEPPPPEVIAAGIAEELTGDDGSSEYELTDWGRQGIGVIIAATWSERRHLPPIVAALEGQPPDT